MELKTELFDNMLKMGWKDLEKKEATISLRNFKAFAPIITQKTLIK